MSDIQEFNRNRPLEVVDNVVERWGKVVVPFFIKDPHSNHRIFGYGSGFLVNYDNKVFLVTALHVLNGISNGEALLANINGSSVFINDLVFIKSDQYDIAVASIHNDWAKIQNIKSLFPLPLTDKTPEFVTSNTYVLLGYPGSKNKLNSNTKETTRHLVGYSSPERIEAPRSKTHVTNPIAFKFNKKDAFDSNENKINVGGFNGNSGGPVLEILIKKDTVNTISVSLAGVFIGWDKDCQELVCCRSNVVVSLIDELISKLNDIIQS